MSGSDDRKRLRRVRVLLASARAEDRAQGMKELVELCGSADTAVATASQDLLASNTAEERREVDPELDDMATRWMGLRSPMHPQGLDHRFTQWFADAEHLGDQLAALAPRMIATAGDWLAEYERGAEEERLGRFDAWAELVRAHPSSAAILAVVLTKQAALKSRRLLAVRKRAIESAIGRGDLIAAHHELREIERSQDLPAEEIVAIGELVRELEQRKAEIESWRNEVAGAPRGWDDVVRIHEVWAKGRRLAQLRGTPGEWAQNIAGELEILQSLAGAFVARRAAECDSFEAIRTEAKAIRGASAGREPIDPAWLDPLSAAVVSAIDREVERAEGVDALRALGVEAAAIAANLPAAGGPRVSAALRRIHDVIAAWSTVDSDELPQIAATGVLPARLLERVEAARRVAHRIAAAEEAMNRGTTTAERVAACREALAMLEEILGEPPRPAAASGLREIALARLELLRLDEAIERWDSVALRAALRTGNSYETPYRMLLQALPLFERMVELRGRPFAEAADLEALAGWWRSWRRLESKLAAQRPQSLRRALDVVRNDATIAMRHFITEHLGRRTTLDEDRAACNAAGAVAGDLALADELFSLEQRRDIHAEVVAARQEGTPRLAELLRDRWGIVARYLPAADAILSEAFERAWEDADDVSLEALRAVPLPATLGRAERERFRHWLEWLEVERGLSVAVTPDRARRLHSYLQRGGVSIASVGRRLARLIERWRDSGDGAALAWAYRAFAHLDPPLFPGADPLLTLTQQSELDLAAIVDACRAAEIVDEAFIEKSFEKLRDVEQKWERLEQTLLAVPGAQGQAWPAPPPQLQQTKRLLIAFRSILDSIARWKQSDVRPLGEECDGVRRLLMRELASCLSAQSFDRVLRRLEPLTRLNGLQRHLRDACARCASELQADRQAREPFAEAARYLDSIIRALLAAQPEGNHTLQVVSDEFWREMPPMAGDLLPAEPGGGLDALHRRLLALNENELLFRQAVDVLWREQPNIGAAGEFDAAPQGNYLAHYPGVPPASIRVRRLFDDFAARSAQRVILRKSRHLLPEWLQTYVDRISRGVSPW